MKNQNKKTAGSNVPTQASRDKFQGEEHDGEAFEEQRAVVQELTFNEAERAFKRFNVVLSEKERDAIGLRTSPNGPYANLGLFLSDQCRHTIKIAVFGDEENTILKDVQEFGGSVLKQFEDSYARLTLCNRIAPTFKSLERDDRSDYPEDAVREALLNALTHRDYSVDGSIIVNVNESRVDFISIGGLLPGFCVDDIRNGAVLTRNRKLVKIFRLLKLVDSYGVGLRKIYACYKNCVAQPQIQTTPNTFKLTLPNKNVYSGADEAKSKAITPQMKAVLDYLTEYGKMTEDDFQELLNVKKTRAYLLARKMVELGLIEVVGRGATKIYALK